MTAYINTEDLIIYVSEAIPLSYILEYLESNFPDTKHLFKITSLEYMPENITALDSISMLLKYLGSK